MCWRRATEFDVNQPYGKYHDERSIEAVEDCDADAQRGAKRVI